MDIYVNAPDPADKGAGEPVSLAAGQTRLPLKRVVRWLPKPPGAVYTRYLPVLFVKQMVSPLPHYPLSPLARAGVLVRPLADAARAAAHPPGAAHHDAHYLLVLLTAGELHLTLDFEELTLRAPAVLLISPGQVHQLRGATAPQGWGVSFEPSLVAEDTRALLEQQLRQPVTVQPTLHTRAETLLALLADCQQDAGPTTHLGPALQALLAALLHLLANELAPLSVHAQGATTRGQELLAGFYRLLRQHFRDWKQPAQYAAALAVTVSHLNDTVKARSGYPVSQHLQARTILEAKRLLFYSDEPVKQIGYALGYDEPVYFGKLFKKVTGLTPQQFRRTIRE
ncbi:AraC family transcriptional regulator [Hymenobacter tibetensis]|uniref:AraC family transcriptional regulator n=1 Tax=Hymenobacter tibetensis TaxID=497967 RepID=A0ABY4CTT5_9BACT|nr:helix-turn-helix transcriptional regulator [Hymenobacter tibetensis]UOG73447.1 AraC family transcriptional regulator [Hymenobacter tibetensis]